MNEVNYKERGETGINLLFWIGVLRTSINSFLKIHINFKNAKINVDVCLRMS